MEMLIFWMFYYLIVNILTLFLFKLDKKRAIKKTNRISERTLMFMCFIGGSLGGMIAMYHYHHKTKKSMFKIGVPIFLVMNGYAGYVLLIEISKMM